MDQIQINEVILWINKNTKLMESLFSFNPNPLVRYLQKPAELFTREDLIKFVEGNQIQELNFRYVGRRWTT